MTSHNLDIRCTCIVDKTMKKILLIAALLCPLSILASTQEPLSLPDARHLLTRTGIGASPTEIENFIGLTRRQAVEKIIAGLQTEPQSQPPEWTKKASPYHWRTPELSSKEKQKFRVARYNEMQSLRRWWVQEMISTTSPQTERLTLFWHNHFATSFLGINNQAISIARQHAMFREYGSGNFRQLLKQIIRDPAMLNYLDNNNSNKEKPNENFARELMELFSLGEGNYTEQDVKNAARALTGYTIEGTNDQQFMFRYWAHDNSEKSIFGKTGNFNGDDLVDLILTQPAAARFITAKFWYALVSNIKPDRSRLAVHANAFRQSDYDIKTLYKSILLSEDFWNVDNRATIVQSPVALTIGTIRSTGILPSDWQTLPSTLAQMGQQLFDPPNVAGWPGGKAWITPGRLLTRLEWLKSLAAASSDAGARSAGDAVTSTNMMASEQEDSDSFSTGSQNLQGDNMMIPSAAKGEPHKQLQVRIASEEFDGHVKYSVTLFGSNGPLWESGQIELVGGHNTQHMGRIDKRNMPWQQITFPVDIDENNVKAVEVAFHNDKTAPPNADRNLFVSRITLGKLTWLPYDGKQTSLCARKSPERQGELYCEGNVRIEKSTDVHAVTTPVVSANTLRAGSASMRSVKVPGKKGANIVYTLSDVEFDGRFWNTLNIRYLLDKNGNYSIRMHNYDCWPACIEEWPECVWKNEFGTLTLSLALKPQNKEQQCMYEELSEADNRFVHALWTVAPDIYQAVSDSKKLQKRAKRNKYNQWQAHIDKIKHSLEKSPHNSQAIRFEVVERPAADYTIDEVIAQPVPASTTNTDRQRSLDQIRKQKPGLNLQTLLLPSPPSNGGISSNPSLDEVITDLAFQLN